MKVKNMIKIIFIILLAIAVAIGGIALFFKFKAKDHILDGPGMINTREGELVGVSYSYGGGMEGDSLYYSLTPTDVYGIVLFEYSYCPGVGQDTVTASKDVSAEYFDNIRVICRQTGCLLQAENGKPSELQLLDAPTAHITFTLSDKESITMHSNYDYPSSCEGLFGMVVSEMKKILDAEIKPEDMTTQAWGEI